MSAFERPGLYPYHAESEATTLPTVAELAGYIPTTIADPGIANALGKSGGRWDQYLDLVSFRVNTLVDDAIACQVSKLSLTYPTGAGVANLTPATYPTIVYGGLHIEVDQAGLSLAALAPATFAVNSRTWIYMTIPSAPGSYPTFRSETVALATPAAPIGDELTLVGVDTDGSNVTANVAGDVSDILTLDRPVTFAGSTTMITVEGSTADPLMVLENTGSGYALDEIDGGIRSTRFYGVGNADSLPTMTLDPTTGAASLRITDSGGALPNQAALYVTHDEGAGISVESTGSALVGIYVENSVGYALAIESPSPLGAIHVNLTDAAAGYGIEATSISNKALYYADMAASAASTTGAIYALGNSANAGVAIRGVARWSTSAGISGETSNAASFDTPAIVGTGGGTSGSGVKGVALGNGYGVIAEGDANNPPARGSLRIVPQLTDATTGQIGDVEFRSDTGEARLYTQQGGSSGWRSVHTSSRGYVWAFGAKQSGGPISGGTTGWIGDATIYPVQTGNVLVTVTGTLDFASAHDAVEIQLRELNAGLIGTAQVVSSDGTGGGAGQFLPLTLQAIFTLPDTSSRTFQVLIDSTVGTFDYDNVIVSVQGIQSP